MKILSIDEIEIRNKEDTTKIKAELITIKRLFRSTEQVVFITTRNNNYYFWYPSYKRIKSFNFCQKLYRKLNIFNVDKREDLEAHRYLKLILNKNEV